MVYVIAFRLANGFKMELIGDNIREIMDKIREWMDEKKSPIVDLDVDVRPASTVRYSEN